MFHKYLLLTSCTNRHTLFRYRKDFSELIARNSIRKYHLINQCRKVRNFSLTSKVKVPWSCRNFEFQKSNGSILTRVFCTKSPKNTDRSWLTIRRQHRESNREIRRLFTLAKNEKWYLIGAIGCLVVSTSVTIGVPHAIGRIMDMVVLNNFPKEKMSSFCVILLGVFIAGSLANFGRIYLMNSASKC